MKDIDNYEYLRGFADACGVNWDLADKDDFPEGLNSYDEVFDRMYELKDSATPNDSVFLIKSFGGGHGQGSSEIIGCFHEMTPQLKADRDKEWWSVEELKVTHYKPKINEG